MLSNPVSCYFDGYKCYIKDDNSTSYTDVTEEVWKAVTSVTEGVPIPIGGPSPENTHDSDIEKSPVQSTWNLTAFPCGQYSVFTYIDRTTKYDLWLEEVDNGKSFNPSEPRRMCTSVGEAASTGDGGYGTLKLSVHGTLDNYENKPTWTNTNDRPVVLSVLKMTPNPVFYGGPYWTAPGSTGLANDSGGVTINNCRPSDMYTVILMPGESINYTGPGDGSESYWSVNYCTVDEYNTPETRIHTRLIDGTVCECIYDQEILVDPDTCETKRIPIIWRTKDLKGVYTDIEGKTRHRGEYIFIDPFAPHDVYRAIHGASQLNPTGALHIDSGKIFQGIDEQMYPLGGAHIYAHSPDKWRTELIGALQPPDTNIPATQTENKSFELDADAIKKIYKYKQLSQEQLRRIYMTQDGAFAVHYDSDGQIQKDIEKLEDKDITNDEDAKLIDGSDQLAYAQAWAEIENYGTVPSLEIDGFTAQFESGIAEQMVNRFCKDFTKEGNIKLGTMPIIWFNKIHDEQTATVVFKGKEKVAQFPFACAGVSQFGTGMALMCLEHVHNNDPMMTEHAHLQVFVKEPRSETWGFEHSSFTYGGGGVNTVSGSSKQHNHFGTSNHHYTHATLSPYLPNIFGTPEVGTPPLSNQSGTMGNTVLLAGANFGNMGGINGGTFFGIGSSRIPSGADDFPLADDKAIEMDTSQEMIKPDTKEWDGTNQCYFTDNPSSIGKYLAAKPSYALILLSGTKGKEDRDEDVMPSERPRSSQNDSSIIWRVGNMESPIAYDHAGHWRESWADLGVQSGVPLSGGISPWNGLPTGYRAFSGGGTPPWANEEDRMEDALKHSQFDFVPSKPFVSESGVGVVGSNGMLVCFDNAGNVIKYNIEHFALEEVDRAIVPTENKAIK